MSEPESGDTARGRCVGAVRCATATGAAVMLGVSATAATVRYPGVSSQALALLVAEAGVSPPLDTINRLAALNSVRASDDYAAAATLIAERARHRTLRHSGRGVPCRWETWYGAFLSEPGWRVQAATLTVSTGSSSAGNIADVLVDYDRTPLGLV